MRGMHTLKLAGALFYSGCLLLAADKAKKDATAELLATTNVLSVHLNFDKAEWERIQPPAQEGMLGARSFGPGMFLAPVIIQASDKNADEKLSREELLALGNQWFTDWDTDKKDSLNDDAIKAGLNKTIGSRPPTLNLRGKEGKRNGLASTMLGIDFVQGKVNATIDGKELKDTAVRYKGNGTFMMARMSDKKSFKLDLNKHAEGRKLKGVSTVNLHNCVTDASYMNEVLSYRLYRDAGVPASRSAYARVNVTVPDKWDRQYLGLYSVIENVDSEFAGDHLGSEKAAIFKPVTPKPFEYLGDDWKKYNQTYDPKSPPTPEQQKRVIDFAKLVSQGSDEEFNARLPDFLDLDNASRYFAVTVWLSTLDSILGIGQNYYVFLHPETKKFGFIPWDLDHSFGQFFLVGSQTQREQLSIHQPWQGEIKFLERLFKQPDFKKLYLARLEEFSKTIFQPERIQKQVDEVAAAILPAVRDESEEKLVPFETVVRGEAAPAKPIKGFVVARAASVNDQLAGKSQGEKIVPVNFAGGPNQQGPGAFLGPALRRLWDADNNNGVTREEMRAGLEKWFTAWSKDKTGDLDEEQVKEGLNASLMGMGPRPGGGRPPGGGPPREGGPGPRP